MIVVFYIGYFIFYVELLLFAVVVKYFGSCPILLGLVCFLKVLYSALGLSIVCWGFVQSFGGFV